MIKTLTVTSEIQAVETFGGINVIVCNRGDATVYVSSDSTVVPDADGVKAIEGSSADLIRNVGRFECKNNVYDYYSTIYMKSDGTTKVQLETTNSSNFRKVAKGGGNGTLNFAGDNGLLAIYNSDIYYYIGELQEIQED